MISKKIAFSLLTVGVMAVSSCDTNDSTTFYLVRHAEKAQSNTMNIISENPPLTEKGKQRAERLKVLLRDKEVTGIYSTNYIRNMNTVQPIAELKNLQINNYEWHNWQPMIDEAKSKHSGEVVIICGHGDNLLPMIEYLNGQKPQESLGAHEYDKIFKVEILPDTSFITTITY